MEISKLCWTIRQRHNSLSNKKHNPVKFKKISLAAAQNEWKSRDWHLLRVAKRHPTVFSFSSVCHLRRCVVNMAAIYSFISSRERGLRPVYKNDLWNTLYRTVKPQYYTNQAKGSVYNLEFSPCGWVFAELSSFIWMKLWMCLCLRYSARHWPV